MIKIYGYSDQFQDFVFADVDDAVNHAVMNAARISQKEVIFCVYQYELKRMNNKIAASMFHGSLENWEEWAEDRTKISELRTNDFDQVEREYFERVWNDPHGDV